MSVRRRGPRAVARCRAAAQRPLIDGRASPADRRARAGRASLFLALGLLALLPAGPLHAQAATGSVAGRVTAEGDSAVIGATVLVDGTLLSAITDRAGGYRITGLPPGHYTLHVVAMGYGGASHANVAVAGGATSRVDFSLATSPVELPGVIVTASRGTQQPGASPASVAVITQKDITQRDITQLSQALPFASGVTYAGGTLDIRGAAGYAQGVGGRVLLMLDGHPLLTGDTGEADFDALPVMGVQRIEIVKGPYSALYGSNALGGVVNIITSPIPDQSHTVFRAHMGAYDVPSQYSFASGLLSFQGLEVQHSLRIGDVGLRLFGDRDTNDGFTQNGRISRWLFRTEVSTPLFGAAPSSFYVIGAQEDVGEFFTWRSADERYEVPADAVGDWYRNGWLNFGATLNLLTHASALLRVSPYVYYDAVRNHFHDNHDYHEATRAGSSIQLSLVPGAGQSLTLGGEGAYNTVHSNILGTPVVRDYALFAQDEIHLDPRLELSVGARFDDHAVTPGHVNKQLSPKLGAVYHATSSLSLRASLSHAFRAPSPVEQFVSTTEYGVQVVPNPDLGPETVTAGELGATADLGRLWLDGAVFQSHYDGLIQPAPVSGRYFVYQFQNVARARITGTDMEARIDVVPRLLGLDLTYMYLDTRDLNANQPLPYRSNHTATGTVTVLGGLVNLDLQFRSRVQRVLQFPLDPRGATTLLGLRLAYMTHGILLQGKISNLLNQQYVDVQERLPGAPRSFMVSISSGM
jgi:outer membrane receptor for ferrienterochelin and colicins